MIFLGVHNGNERQSSCIQTYQRQSYHILVFLQERGNLKVSFNHGGYHQSCAFENFLQFPFVQVLVGSTLEQYLSHQFCIAMTLPEHMLLGIAQIGVIKVDEVDQE